MPDGKTALAVTRGTNWAALRGMAENADSPATDESHWSGATIGLPTDKTSIHTNFDATRSSSSSVAVAVTKPA